MLSPVGVSAGAVELRRDDDAESFFQRADEALYRAKAWGKGRLAWGDGDRPEPPAEAGYGDGNAVFSCGGCARFRPGKGRSGYCEEWHAPVEPTGVCRVFEPRTGS